MIQDCGIGGNQLQHKKIIGAGCSFIQGCELGDENSSLGYSVQTYPALIAKHFDLPYECLAYGGASNTGIAKMILDHDIQDAILMVQWTYESRIGLQINLDADKENKNGINWFDLAPNNWLFDSKRWTIPTYVKNLIAGGVDKFQENFYKYAGNDETFLLLTDLAMKSVAYQASQKNAKTIFFSASDNLLGLNGCQGFNGQDFVAWANDNNCAIGQYGHPLHEAHRLTADYIIDNVNMFDD